MTSDAATVPPTWFRGFVQGKTRIALAWGFAGAMLVTARAAPAWPGIAVCFLGATLRFWASGYLRKDTKPAVGGPYAFVRNPLYLGTYLMAVGTVASTQVWWLLAAITVTFAVLYHFIILDEETKLARLFGQAYAAYCVKVPRFFPRAWPAEQTALAKINGDTEAHRYSWNLAMKNKAYEAYASFAALIAAVWAVALIWERLG